MGVGLGVAERRGVCIFWGGLRVLLEGACEKCDAYCRRWVAFWRGFYRLLSFVGELELSVEDEIVGWVLR